MPRGVGKTSPRTSISVVLIFFHILVLQEYWVLTESRIPLKLVLGCVRMVALSMCVCVCVLHHIQLLYMYPLRINKAKYTDIKKVFTLFHYLYLVIWMNFDILCCLENCITNLIYSLYVTIIITLPSKYYVHVYNVNTAAQGP